jgi:peroxiredoxin Q/BCP
MHRSLIALANSIALGKKEAMAARKKSSKAKRARTQVAAAVGAVKRGVARVVKKVKKAASGTKPSKPKRAKRLGHRPVAPAPKGAKVRPKQKSAPAREGGPAPEFSLLDENGQLFSSHVLAGKRYVLYFYPKDDTPGCTKEACDFRDHMAELARAGIRVIGISPDSAGSHARFRDKYDLEFTLLSDEDRTVAKAFGVWVKKQNYGREYMGIERSTFLIDADGRIARVWRGVRVPGHVEAVLAEARRA